MSQMDVKEKGRYFIVCTEDIKRYAVSTYFYVRLGWLGLGWLDFGVAL